MFHATLWVSTAVPLNAPTVSRNSSGVAQREKKYSEVTSFPQRTSRGPTHAFFVQIKRGPVKQNKRAPRSSQLCSKTETSSLSDEIPLACSDQVFCLSYTTQTAVVSRGMTKCSNVAVLVYTMGHQKKTMFMKDIYQRYHRSYCHSLHTFMLTNTSTHCCINKHSGTHVTPVTAPNRNGYFFIKQILLAL